MEQAGYPPRLLFSGGDDIGDEAIAVLPLANVLRDVVRADEHPPGPDRAGDDPDEAPVLVLQDARLVGKGRPRDRAGQTRVGGVRKAHGALFDEAETRSARIEDRRQRETRLLELAGCSDGADDHGDEQQRERGCLDRVPRVQLRQARDQLGRRGKQERSREERPSPIREAHCLPRFGEPRRNGNEGHADERQHPRDVERRTGPVADERIQAVGDREGGQDPERQDEPALFDPTAEQEGTGDERRQGELGDRIGDVENLLQAARTLVPARARRERRG